MLHNIEDPLVDSAGIECLLSLAKIWRSDEDSEHGEAPEDHPHHPEPDGCAPGLQRKEKVNLHTPQRPFPFMVDVIVCVYGPQVNANELTNGVINAAFMLLFKDAIRLFAAYNEGIINLLGKG